MTGLFQLLIFCLVAVPLAIAETVSFQIDYLPLAEAEGLVRMELSPSGHLQVLESRNQLVVRDDHAHIEKIRGVVHRFDTSRPSVLLEFAVFGVSRELLDSDMAGGMDLPGGWKKLPVRAAGELVVERQHRFNSGDSFSFRTGKIRPIRSSIRHWLSRHDIRDSPDMGLSPIYAGFDVRVQLLRRYQIRVSIRPWIRRRADPESSTIHRDTGILVPPGVINQQDSPAWVEAHPFHAGRRAEKLVKISEADIEVTVPAGKFIELVAAQGEAAGFGEAALSSDSSGFRKLLTVRIGVKSKK